MRKTHFISNLYFFALLAPLFLAIACGPPTPKNLIAPTPQSPQAQATVPPQPPGLNTAYFLRRFHDFRSLAIPRPNERLVMTSSHQDQSEVEDVDAFLGEYKMENKTWKVLLDQEGPGCVVRFWTSDQAQGNLRIYFDREPTPRIETSLREFFSGSYKNFKEHPVLKSDPTIGGFVSYFPMPFAKHCQIMTDSTAPGFQYQVNALTFTDNTNVTTFNPDLNAEELKEMEELNQRLGTRSYIDYANLPLRKLENIVLEPGARRMVINLPGPAAINFLQIVPEPLDDEVLTRVQMQMFWDDFSEPSVDTTLSQFFCHTQSKQTWLTYPLGLVQEKSQLFSRYYMPFQKRAQIFLANQSSKPITFYLSFNMVKENVPADAMYFFARSNQQQFLNGLLFPFMNCEGMGTFVGFSLMTHSQPFESPHFYMEGDEYFYVDGEADSSWNGTGADNYFNADNRLLPSAYFWNPISGCLWKAETDGGLSSCFRFHFLDAIPFQTSLLLLREIGSPPMYMRMTTPSVVPVNCSWTCYWYAKPAAREIKRSEKVMLYTVDQSEQSQPTTQSPAIRNQRLQIKLPTGTWWIHMAPIWDLNQVNHQKQEVGKPNG